MKRTFKSTPDIMISFNYEIFVEAILHMADKLDIDRCVRSGELDGLVETILRQCNE